VVALVLKLPSMEIPGDALVKVTTPTFLVTTLAMCLQLAIPIAPLLRRTATQLRICFDKTTASLVFVIGLRSAQTNRRTPSTRILARYLTTSVATRVLTCTRLTRIIKWMTALTSTTPIRRNKQPSVAVKTTASAAAQGIGGSHVGSW
jgi:hypothetical protein